MPRRDETTGNLFISYRREDSAAYAGRLCDHFGAVFGPEHVFMDAEDIAPGQIFTDTIHRTLAGCEAVLVVIGPRWREILLSRTGQGEPDYVRQEIEAAIDSKIRIIPVLVGGATIAQLEDLPGKLVGLRFFHAAELRDSTFKDDCVRLAGTLGGRRGWLSNRATRRKLLIGTLAGALAAVILFSLAGSGRSKAGRTRNDAALSLLNTATSQAARGEYQSAFQTTGKALQIDPLDTEVMELQTDAAMGWLRDFRVLVSEGQKAEEIAAPRLAELIAVLDAALARTNKKSGRAADLLAHLGWAHWLNQKIAQQEFGTAAERDLRQALQTDPENVYAHAMLGNWLLQRNGSTEEALRHFEAAIRTHRERPFVRRLQLGAMAYDREPAVVQAMIRAVNDMRKDGEVLDETYRRRILTAYSPTVNDRADIKAALSALSPEDAWATYEWLDASQAGGTDRRKVEHAFVKATILELAGRQQEALAAFTALSEELKRLGYSGRIVRHVSQAIEVLTAPLPSSR